MSLKLNLSWPVEPDSCELEFINYLAGILNVEFSICTADNTEYIIDNLQIPYYGQNTEFHKRSFTLPDNNKIELYVSGISDDIHSCDVITPALSLFRLDFEKHDRRRDRFGLVEGRRDPRFMSDCLHVPFVDNLAVWLAQQLNLKITFPGKAKFIVTVSCDVDYLNQNELERAITFLGEHRVKTPSFFIYAGKGNAHDPLYRIREKQWRDMLAPLLESDAELAVHGGYVSYDDPGMMREERECLEQIAARPIYGYRSHYLRFSAPRTWYHLANSGYTYDVSLGYPDCFGVRGGWTRPAKAFCPDEPHATIWKFPICYMDQNFFWPDILPEKKVNGIIQSAISAAAASGGTICLDWHTHTNGNDNWWQVLHLFLTEAIKAGGCLCGAYETLKAYNPDFSHSNSIKKQEGRNYYNQPELWNEVAEYQKNVLEDILHFIPADVTSILDAGCGNGYVINALSGRYSCSAVDISSTALESVQVEKKLGTVDALPFPDESFDLVMINDVLEHLPESTLQKTLAELLRVAGKYILVTVPFLENMQAGMTCCGHCGTVYHITRHVRSFGPQELLGLFGDKLRPERLIYSGVEHDIRDICQYEIRAGLHLHTAWDKAVCPVCGAKASADPAAGLDTAPYYAGINEIPKDPLFLPPMRNECIALFRKDRLPSVLTDSGVSLLVDGQKVKSSFLLENGKRLILSEAHGEYCHLEFISDGVIHTYPRPTPVPDLGYIVPGWFNNSIISSASDEFHSAVLNQYLLLRHARTESLNTRLSEEISELKSVLQDLQNVREEYLNPIIDNFVHSSWAGWRGRIEKLALPDIRGEAPVGNQRFLVICHDQDLDRRILQQVEALTGAGWCGVIVALSFDAEDHLEEQSGCLVHRVGLKHIVPDCKCYWMYRHLLYLTQRRFKLLPQSVSSSLCNFVYRVLGRLHYRCANIKHPLPFDSAFLSAACYYPADLIIAEDLPALKAAALLKRQWKCRLFFDSHEFYPEQRVFSATQKKIMHQIAGNYINDCDLVSTVSDGIADLFQQYYDIKKPAVLHNVTRMENIERGYKFHQLLGLGPDRKIILYQGGIIPDRNIDNLLAGFVKLNPENARLVFLGPSAPKFLEKLRHMAGPLLDCKVHFLEAVPRDELLAYTASADFGVIPYRVIDLNTKFCLPNKFFEFIQAGLPILSNELIEVEKILQQIGGGGMIADLNSPDKAAMALQKMLERELEQDHRALCRARFTLSWEHESQSFMKLIESLFQQNSVRE